VTFLFWLYLVNVVFLHKIKHLVRLLQQKFFKTFDFIFLTSNFKIMAIIITDECINCGACEPECPNTAIYEGADDWRWKDGTKLSGKIILPDGTEIDSDAAQTPISDDLYYIVPGKCTECKGFHEEPQCAAVCPVDCCVPDDNHVESEETLLNRQAFLHNE
jgi:ferredoxin